MKKLLLIGFIFVARISGMESAAVVSHKDLNVVKDSQQLVHPDYESQGDHLLCKILSSMLNSGLPLTVKTYYWPSSEKEALISIPDMIVPIIKFDRAIHKQDVVIKCKVEEDGQSVAQRSKYAWFILRLTSFLKDKAKLHEREGIISIVKGLLSRNEHDFWPGLLIDSLYEIYKSSGFTKLLLALELNEENRLELWIVGYLKFHMENNQELDINSSVGGITSLSLAKAKGFRSIILLLVEAGAIDL